MKLRDVSRMVAKGLRRWPMRSAFTVLGIALAAALLVGIESFASAMDDALRSGDKARTLIVYRKNRFCPQTSNLPERYERTIASVPGVRSVLPVKVFLNNCRTNLDMITFQGTPVETLLRQRDLQLVAGDMESFRRERDAALVGAAFALRRGLSVGDKFQFGPVVVKVSGIFRSSDSVQESLVLTHLEFLQRSAEAAKLGTVTQFEVRIDDADAAGRIADEIDRRLASAEEPTKTRIMASFLDRATKDLQEILRFGRYFGLACVLVVLVLTANTISMSVHQRTRELGVLRAIGFRGEQLGVLVLSEALVLALLGAILGEGLMVLAIAGSGLAIGVEGIQVGFAPTLSVLAFTLGLVCGAALLASLLPALRAVRLQVVDALKGGE